MLERSIGCLYHGGRTAWRPHKHTFRSHQMLQSTFWRHGAGDLELPWWAYTILRNHLFDSHAELSCKNGKFSAQSYVTIVSRDNFLDFLYPEKALRMLRSLSSSGIRRLRRQSACHVANLCSRHYGSVAPRKDALANLELKSSASFTSDANTESGETSVHANSSLHPLEDLEAILNSDDRNKYPEAWSLFSSLPPSNHTVALSIRLLLYLSTSSRLVDSKRAKTLFYLVPDEQRTSAVASSLIKIYLRQGQSARAVALHKVASCYSALDIGTSYRLLLRCISEEQWEFALDVFEDYFEATAHPKLNAVDGYPRAQIQQQFLKFTPTQLSLSISRIPGIVEKVCSFISNVTTLFDFSSLSESTTLRKFLYIIIHSIPDRLHNSPLGLIIRLLDNLKTLGLSRPCTYELYVESLLNSRSLRKTLACYCHYRESACFNPSLRFLESLIELTATEDDCTTLLMIWSDWQKHLGIPQERICHRLMMNFAHFGDAQAVLDIFNKYVQKHADRVTLFIYYPIFHVFALRLQPEAIEEEFSRMRNDFRLEPDLKCWNILIHAHTRAGDLHEALRCLSYLLDSGKKPDAYTFVPIMGAAASKGDVVVIKQILSIVESSGLAKSTSMIDTLVEAHINNEEMSDAEQVVLAALDMPLKGSRSRMWTQLIAAFAVRKDARNALRVYNMMQQFGVPLNSMTYAALMRVLTALKQTTSAYSILTLIMPRAKIRVRAVHYAIVIQGFAGERNITKMNQVLHLLHKSRLQPTISTQRAIINANMIESSENHKRMGLDHPGLRFDAGDAVLDEILSVADVATVSCRQPLINGQNMPLHQRFPAAYFDVVMSMYDRQKSHEMVENLLDRYIEVCKSRQPNQDLEMPLVIIRIMMASNYARKCFQDVEKYWLLAKGTMRRLFGEGNETGLLNMPISQTYALSRHFEIYMKALSAQPDAFVRLRNAFQDYVAEGLAFNHSCMNLYVRLLISTIPMYRCGTSFSEKPYWSIPFEICELRLMNEWPGWLTSPVQISNSFRRLSSPELEYLNVRFLKRGQCVASYKTLFKLRGLLHALKRRALVSAAQRLVLVELQKKAPRTLEAIESMPEAVWFQRRNPGRQLLGSVGFSTRSGRPDSA